MKIGLVNVTSTMDVIGSAEVGGVEAYTFRLGESLKRRGHEVVLFGGRPKLGRSFQRPSFEVRLVDYIETTSIPHLGTRFRRLLQRLQFFRSMKASFSLNEFDALMIFKPYDFVAAWFWRRAGFRGRIVASLHGPEFYATDRWFAKAIDAMYAVNDSIAGAVKSRYGHSCGVIPNFIDLLDFAFMKRSSAPEGKNILASGRLVGWKGMNSLISAFTKVYGKMSNARLTILGDGPERGNLRKQAISLGVADVVKLPGAVDAAELRRIYAEAWLYVQPSIGYESFSIATLEAAALGVPALVSNKVGIAAWFGREDGLEVFPFGNEDALAEAILRRLNESWDISYARALAARRLVERKFGADVAVKGIEKLCSKS